MGGHASFIPAEDGGGYALLNLVVVGGGARVGIVPAPVVGCFDGSYGIGMRELGEGKVGGDGVERVVCGSHCG